MNIILANFFIAFVVVSNNIFKQNNKIGISLKNKDNYYEINNYEKKNKFSKNILKTTTNIDIDILDNEIDYLLNNNLKVYLHIEQLFKFTNIYHVGITFKSIYKEIRYDIVGLDLINRSVVSEFKLNKTIFWDYSFKTINEVIKYESNMKFNYVLGINDCRHYVRNLTTWACNNPSPVWKLKNLL